MAKMKEFRDRIIELRRVRADEIENADWNYRKHPQQQKEALAGSIEELGFFDPLDCWEPSPGRLMLVDGQARRDLIHAEIGPDTLIPVIVSDFDEAEAKKALAVKDQITGMAETDPVKFEALLREINVESQALADLLTATAEELDLVPKDVDLPEDFPEVDEDIETEHTCPKCGYRFSNSDT